MVFSLSLLATEYLGIVCFAAPFPLGRELESKTVSWVGWKKWGQMWSRSYDKVTLDESFPGQVQEVPRGWGLYI